MAKSAEAFRTISEVSELLDTPAHVLRFWESRFSQVRPVKRAGGRRYYRPTDIALLDGIRRLLHDDGLTIRGAQKILREQGVKHVAALSQIVLDDAAPEPYRAPAAPVSDSMPDPAPAAPPRLEPLTLWPATPSPDAAPPTGRLLPDPEDPAVPEDVAEAPMILDAPTLPFGNDNIRQMGTEATPVRSRPAPTPSVDTPDATAQVEDETPDNAPAATLLRAMDALRARDKRSELTSVYNRLTNLHDRLSRDGGSSPR